MSTLDDFRSRIAEGEPLLPHEASSLVLELEREHLAERARLVEQVAELRARRRSLMPDLDGLTYISLVGTVALCALGCLHILNKPTDPQAVLIDWADSVDHWADKSRRHQTDECRAVPQVSEALKALQGVCDGGRE